MRIIVPCPYPECGSFNRSPDTVYYAVSVSDDFVCRFSCDRGHTVAVPLQQVRFELLAQAGAVALLDGYYREAVSSFAACLERFYEFYLSVVAMHHGIFDDHIKKAWKIIAKQSERQLGAFVYTYFVENKTLPVVMNSDDVAFRNKVIHQGQIPSREQAFNFGVSVINIIDPILAKMKSEMSDSVQDVYVEHLKNTQWTVDWNKEHLLIQGGVFIFDLHGNGEPSSSINRIILQIELIENQRNRGVIRYR